MQTHAEAAATTRPFGHRPVVLPKYTTAQVKALTSLQQKNILFSVASEIWRLHFSAQATQIASHPICVRGNWMGHSVVLWFPQTLLQRTLRACFPDLLATPIPQALFPAVASNAVGIWLDALPHRTSLRIDAIDDGQPLPSADSTDIGHAVMRIYLQAQCIAASDTTADVSQEHTVVIDADPALIAALSPLCASLGPAKPTATPAALLAVQLPLLCEIGRTTLPYRMLKTIGAGDIVFFHPHTEHGSPRSISSVSLRLSHRRFPLMRARIQQPDLMVITSIDMNDSKSFSYDEFSEDPALSPAPHLFQASGRSAAHDESVPEAFRHEMASDEASEMRTAPLASLNESTLNQLPLEVVFDVGRCEMRLDELSRLQPGAVIALTSCMPEIVRMTVNGQLIASGELVEIDGRVGVLVARLADAP